MVNSLENIDKSKVDVSRIEGISEEIQTQITNTITGAASTVITSDLTESRAVVSSATGKIAVSDVTSTELGYLDGVTSAIQTQLNGKQATLESGTNIKTVNSTSLLGSGDVTVQPVITGAASTITSSNLTANRALISNNSGKIAVSSITSTKLGYLTDVTSNIQEQLNSKAGAVVGSIIAYAGTTIPSGYLLCDGSAISRTTYSALFSAIGTTYGAGDGNSTFNLPYLTNGKFIEGCSFNDEYYGQSVSPGLPEITGGFDLANGAATRYDSNTSGCFSKGTSTLYAPYFINESGWAALYFNASLSSSIYGNSNTVQPYSTLMAYCIKY